MSSRRLPFIRNTHTRRHARTHTLIPSCTRRLHYTNWYIYINKQWRILFSPCAYTYDKLLLKIRVSKWSRVHIYTHTRALSLHYTFHYWLRAHTCVIMWNENVNKLLSVVKMWEYSVTCPQGEKEELSLQACQAGENNDLLKSKVASLEQVNANQKCKMLMSL